MRAAGALIGGLWSLRLSRFAAIGGAATLIYAVAAYCLSGGMGTSILPAATASLLAYFLAAVFSYLGHKYVTFLSPGTHSFEAPRFVALTAVGLGFAWLLPTILVDGAGLPPAVPIIVTCILVPVVNYLLLDRWVFASGKAGRLR